MTSVAVAAVAALLAASPDQDQLLGIRMGMTFDEFSRAFPAAECTAPERDGWRGVRVCALAAPDATIARAFVSFRPAWGDRAFRLSVELDRRLLHREFATVLTARFGRPQKQFQAGDGRCGRAVEVWEWSSRDLHVKYGHRLFAQEWYASVVFLESPAHAKWLERELKLDDGGVVHRTARTTVYAQ